MRRVLVAAVCVWGARYTSTYNGAPAGAAHGRKQPNAEHLEHLLGIVRFICKEIAQFVTIA